MNVIRLVSGDTRGRKEVEVEGKAKGATDSGNTADNVGTIDGRAVPSIRSGVRSFNKNGMRATIVTGDHDGFVQKAVETLDADSFVIASGGHMDIDIKRGANGLK